MKKVVNVFLVLLLTVGIFIPMAGVSGTNIKDLLAPYQQVIDKVNNELGSTTFIPSGDEKKVYNNIKNMTLSDFEIMLRKEYLDTLTQSSFDDAKQSDSHSLVNPIPNPKGSIPVTPLT